MDNTELKWFAARVISDKPYVIRYLDCAGIRHEGIADIRSLMFVRCSEAAVKRVCYELFNRLLVYRDAVHHNPQPIADDVMETFLRMAPYHEEPVMFLSVRDTALFDGPRKIVTKGVFAGCEGVIKRIKGERRLIVKISDDAAIATPYIPQEFLEEIK